LEFDDNSLRNCEKLIEQYSDNLKRLCQIKLNYNVSEIDDVIPETNFAFMVMFSNGKLPDNPKAWLYGTANNIIKKKYSEIDNDKKHKVSLDSDFYDLSFLYATPDFAEDMISDEHIERLAQEIERELDKEENIILELFHHEHKSLREIADVLGKSEAAVKQKHYRLCRKIKKRVKEILENSEYFLKK